MVASNFFGDFSNWLITWNDFDFLSFNSFFSIGVNEKKATSEPDISAENNNKIIKATKEIIEEVEMGLNISKINIEVSMGEGSNWL